MKDESSVLFTYHNLEFYIMWILNKRKLSIYVDNEYVKGQDFFINDWIDVELFNKEFGYYPKETLNTNEITESKQNINTINKYYGINLYTYSTKKFVKFLKKIYLKEFKDINNVFHLNLTNLGEKRLNTKHLALETIKEKIKKYKHLSID